jgi:hypothetical protein
MTVIIQIIFVFCLFVTIVTISEKVWDWKIKEWNSELVKRKKGDV